MSLYFTGWTVLNSERVFFSLSRFVGLFDCLLKKKTRLCSVGHEIWWYMKSEYFSNTWLIISDGQASDDQNCYKIILLLQHFWSIISFWYLCKKRTPIRKLSHPCITGAIGSNQNWVLFAAIRLQKLEKPSSYQSKLSWADMNPQ